MDVEGLLSAEDAGWRPLHATFDRLTPDLRLNLLRQLADAIRYAHSKRIIHRALSPQSTLVLTADAGTPTLKIFNWQVGVRTTGAAASGTAHVQELVEAQALVYVAPEALLGPDHITEAADVFSLGAMAYHLFSGRVPAASALALAQTLRAQKGLKVAGDDRVLAVRSSGGKCEQHRGNRQRKIGRELGHGGTGREHAGTRSDPARPEGPQALCRH